MDKMFRLVLIATAICVLLINEGVSQAPSGPNNIDILQPPNGWVDVAKAFMNTMANRFAGWRRNTTAKMSKIDTSMLADAVDRVDKVGNKMTAAKDKINSGYNTATNTTRSWVNSALSWLTGR